jgi:hypothetical protein
MGFNLDMIQKFMCGIRRRQREDAAQQCLGERAQEKSKVFSSGIHRRQLKDATLTTNRIWSRLSQRFEERARENQGVFSQWN